MGIEMQRIKKSFFTEDNKEIEVLKNVNLVINDGEFVAIQGKSGAGKSTLLHVMGCLDKKTDGKYILDGEDISTLSNNQMAKIRNDKFGFIMQDYALINDETVIDNILLPALFSKSSRKEAKQKAKQLLSIFRLEHLLNKKVNLLSGGEKQRVAIMRALILDPDYIFADEPTGALDNQNTLDIMSILSELNRKGKTIIIITHDNSVAEMCNRTICLSDGVIV